MIFEYVLTITLMGDAEPVVTAKAYATKEACMQAGESISKADKAARATDKEYIAFCRAKSKPGT